MKIFRRVKTEDKLDLVLYSSSVKNPRAVIFLVHGMGEHAKRYAHVIEYFKNVNIATVAIDLRGHGNSEGQRGHMPSFDHMMHDLTLSLAHVTNDYKGTPVILYGHSMGGNLILNYLLRNSDGVIGAIATGPYLRLGFDPPKWKVLLAKLSANIYPALSQPTGLERVALARSPQIIDEYENDPLVHDRMTASFFINIHQAGINAIARSKELEIPILLMHGSEDRLTSPEGSKDFHANAGSNVTFHLLEGLYHEVHNEPEKNQVFKIQFEWIEALLK
jgi:alpha-beta hydrolase superfamily lysophospholipase|tara:strand:- start:270 stop:1097 length:828 start_codon:yes stop_codon:yes gene_type:complete